MHYLSHEKPIFFCLYKVLPLVTENKLVIIICIILDMDFNIEFQILAQTQLFIQELY